VGGVTPGQIPVWKAAGATGAGIGSQLFTPGVTLDDLAARATAFAQAWRG
jgi:2-dehydro-3-deoxyphosphogalactonate aldolase